MWPQRGSLHLSPFPRSDSLYPFHRLPVITVPSTEMTVDQTYLDESARKFEIPEKQGTYLDVNTVLTDKEHAKKKIRHRLNGLVLILDTFPHGYVPTQG